MFRRSRFRAGASKGSSAGDSCSTVVSGWDSSAAGDRVRLAQRRPCEPRRSFSQLSAGEGIRSSTTLAPGGFGRLPGRGNAALASGGPQAETIRTRSAFDLEHPRFAGFRIDGPWSEESNKKIYQQYRAMSRSSRSQALLPDEDQHLPDHNESAGQEDLNCDRPHAQSVY